MVLQSMVRMWICAESLNSRKGIICGGFKIAYAFLCYMCCLLQNNISSHGSRLHTYILSYLLTQLMELIKRFDEKFFVWHFVYRRVLNNEKNNIGACLKNQT